MGRLIDADDCKDLMYVMCAGQDKEFVRAMEQVIDDCPDVDAVSVVHGHPVYHNRPVYYEHYEMVQQTENGEPLYKRQYYTLQDNPVAYCPECGKRMCSRFTSYCPNCGADMREAQHVDKR